MADKKKDENKYLKFKTLDDFTNHLESEHAKDIDSAFKAYDKYTHEDSQLHLKQNIFEPAMEKMYTAFKTEVKKLGKDTDKVTNKHKELKKAAVAGLKEFFKIADPTILKIDGLKELKEGKDDEKIYDILVKHYDRITARNPNAEDGEGLVDIIEALSKSKSAKISHALDKMYRARDTHTNRALMQLNQQFLNHTFSKYEHSPHKVGAYVRKEMKKHQWGVSDELEYAKHDLHGYMAIRSGVVNKVWGKGMDADSIHDKYGVKQTPAKESK